MKSSGRIILILSTLQVPKLSYNPPLIRAPVPWRSSYLISKQFCRHNLFITNPVILKLVSVWNNRFSELRFVQMDQLTNQRGDPLSPLDLKQRILDQCETARNVLMKVQCKLKCVKFSKNSKKNVFHSDGSPK